MKILLLLLNRIRILFQLIPMLFIQVLLLSITTSSAWVPLHQPLSQRRIIITRNRQSSPSDPIATFGDATLSDESFKQLYQIRTNDNDNDNDNDNTHENTNNNDNTHDSHGIPNWLLDKAAQCGWKYPTIIQKRAIDSILLQQNDVVLQSQTGSGKTLAYLLPLLSKIQPHRAAIQGLIIVPTRELGLQVARVAKRLTANTNGGIMVMSVLQGSHNKRQRAWAWAEPPQLVIGTPQELTNMVKYGGIKYNSVKFVVVDEVDACLLNNAGSLQLSASGGALHELLSRYLSPTYDDTAGSAQQSQHIIEQKLGLQSSSSSSSSSSIRKIRSRQTVFCSATLPQHRHFMQQCVSNQWTTSTDPVYVCASPGDLLPPTLTHGYMVAASLEKKLTALRRLIQKLIQSSKQQQQQQQQDNDNDHQSTTNNNNNHINRVLIFCETNRPMMEMARRLANDFDQGIIWQEYHGQEQEQNAQAIVSVLNYDDSLSQRASAMLGFQGLDGGKVEGRKFDDEDEKEDEEKERESDEKEELSNSVVVTNDNNDSPNPDNKQRLIRIMFSTDLAARGLDVDGVSHVIHFDLPPDGDTYVHRAGRAGRLGRRGSVVSIITPQQEFVLDRLANKLSLEMTCLGRQKNKPKNKDEQK